jgi:murein L,D-transpeptidase YcbB/YkuD
MRKLMVRLASCALLLAGSGGALAQEAVTINGVQAMRVVIAPPETDLARIIKTNLGTAYYGANPSSRGYADAQKLYYFYGERHFEPLWLSQGTDGTEHFSATAEKIIDVFKDAAAEGFRTDDYITPAIDVTAVGSDPAKLATLETAFSAATIRYAHDAFMGRIAPESVSANIDPETKQLDAAGILMKLATSDQPEQILHGLDPTDREFLALKAALAKADDAPAVAKIVIPDGPVLKPGMKDKRLALLRQRLDVPAPDDGGLTYDPALVEAVKTFQTGLGIDSDGIVGDGTVAALNGDAAISKDDIVANMERWRWLPQDLGTFHVMVNIPEFRVAVVEDGTQTFSTRVVVGKPSTPTPVFSNSIKNIVVNPYWNVPSSIIAKEIAPHMLANPDYLDSQRMELVSGARIVDAAAIDWSSVGPGNFPFSIRQRPGAGNALGNVKFLFPNEHNVYLHDTPSKSLFANSVRAYSHGCVRVQNPMDFADALLKNETNLNAKVLESMYGPSERWVNLKTHVPVHITYFTLRVDPDGTIRSFGDIYGHNKKLISLLNGTGTPAAPVKTPIVSGV